MNFLKRNSTIGRNKKVSSHFGYEEQGVIEEVRSGSGRFYILALKDRAILAKTRGLLDEEQSGAHIVLLSSISVIEIRMVEEGT
jgi:hypothetical protein